MRIEDRIYKNIYLARSSRCLLLPRGSSLQCRAHRPARRPEVWHSTPPTRDSCTLLQSPVKIKTPGSLALYCGVFPYFQNRIHVTSRRRIFMREERAVDECVEDKTLEYDSHENNRGSTTSRYHRLEQIFQHCTRLICQGILPQQVFFARLFFPVLSVAVVNSINMHY